MFKIFTPGRGGNSGRITVQYKQLLGGLKVKACGGRGAEPAENGEGGNGRFFVALVPSACGGVGGGTAVLL